MTAIPARFALLFLALLLSACAGRLPAPKAARPAAAAAAAPVERVPPPEEVLARADLDPDPAWRFGRLANGMFYALRQNRTPSGTAELRMTVAVGSLDEREDERGFAHFVEHMAFNGSERVPEGEMVRLLERAGLAFGADTNAATGYERTTYRLSLPRNDPALLDTGLMLMRETASALTFSPAAVERERGVVLAEARSRDGYRLDELRDRQAFETPGSRHVDRLPIGAPETLEAASAEALRAFWHRHYRPDATTLVIVGDFPLAGMETALRTHFGDWATAPVLAPMRDYGVIDPSRSGETDIYLDPALSERITAHRNGLSLEEHDSAAARRRTILRRIGYGVVNRRLKRLARRADPPFRDAGFGTGEVFRIGRTTRLVVDVVEGGWRRGLMAAATEYRRAVTQGFAQSEIDEQLAELTNIYENAAAAQETRGNSALAAAALRLVAEGMVPTTPADALARLEAMRATITPASVLEELRGEALALNDPLLRFRGRTAPEGGADAIRAAWDEAMAQPLAPSDTTAPPEFAYTDFEPPGVVVADTREPLLGIRTVRFANNVRLNLKRTDLEADRVRVRVSLDGGNLLATREDPLAVALASSLASGGFGRHDIDSLDTILAGRSAGLSFGAAGEVFVSSRTTTLRDLELQLQLLAALITDPGYRPEAVTRYRNRVADYFARIDATPGAALASRSGAVLSDGDPRFSLQPQAAYQALDFDHLRTVIADRLAHGAIEIGIVGDIDEEQAIALVARTFGALPPREAHFVPRPEARQRRFTDRRGTVTITHNGEPDQALIHAVWPIGDDSDAEKTARLELLERIARLSLTEELRERLGKSYSPSAASAPSRIYPGYGTFSLTAAVAAADIAASRAAIDATVARLREEAVDHDLLLRARRPMLEAIGNALKSNKGWLGLVDRAQSEPERIARFTALRARLEAIDAEDIRETARRYLPEGGAITFVVRPSGANR